MNIVAENVGFSYGTRAVLTGVSFEARDGELLSILGPNGVGKSTLFRCILGMLHGYSGHIRIGGAEASELSAKELAKRIAYIPQAHYPSFNYSVFDTVLMGTAHHLPMTSSPGEKEHARAADALEQMGISELASRGYSRLSGGEQRMTLMARALAQNTPILLMDEPIANLDFGNQIRVLSKMRELATQGYTVIQTTHNPEQSFQFSDRVLAIKDGRVLACGTPREIVTDELMREVYGVDIRVESLYDDSVRVCIPKAILRT